MLNHATQITGLARAELTANTERNLWRLLESKVQAAQRRALVGLGRAHYSCPYAYRHYSYAPALFVPLLVFFVPLRMPALFVPMWAF